MAEWWKQTDRQTDRQTASQPASQPETVSQPARQRNRYTESGRQSSQRSFPCLTYMQSSGVHAKGFDSAVGIPARLQGDKQETWYWSRKSSSSLPRQYLAAQVSIWRPASKPSYATTTFLGASASVVAVSVATFTFWGSDALGPGAACGTAPVNPSVT